MNGNDKGHTWAIALIVALFAAITALRAIVDDPAAAVGALYALPIAMVAVRWGIGWGLLTAARGVHRPTCSETLGLDQEISATGDVVRALLFVAAALLVGGYADRARASRPPQRRALPGGDRDLARGLRRDGPRRRRSTAWNREAERTFGLPAARGCWGARSPT